MTITNITEPDSKTPASNSFAPWVHPTGTVPETVNIVACGPSIRSYHSAHFNYDPVIPPAAETWGVNKGLRTQLGHNRNVGFIMDDLVGEAMKSERYRQDVDNLPFPIITSTIDDRVKKAFPTRFSYGNRGLTHEYPVNQVIDRVGVALALARGASAETILDDPAHISVTGQIAGYYLHNSIPFMLAYAWFIGVKKVHLFGCDYTYPGMEAREDDRANTEYWCGFLRSQGLEIWVTQDTTLLNQCKQPYIYGYGARPPIIADPDRTALHWHLSALGIDPI